MSKKLVQELYDQDTIKIEKSLSVNPIDEVSNELGCDYIDGYIGRGGYNYYNNWYFQDDKKTYGDYIPWTALQCASAMGKTTSVRFLLEKGATQSIQDKTGRNAYEIAKFLKQQAVVDLFDTHNQTKIKVVPIKTPIQEVNIPKSGKISNPTLISNVSGSTMNTMPSIPFKNLKILKKLGEGGYGEIYLGKYSNEDVAIKKLPISKDEFFQNPMNEIAFLLKSNHPRIIRCYGWSHDNNDTYIIMELVQSDLDSVLYGNTKTKMSSQQKLQILIDIASGMSYLHLNKFVHRDLKSMNILVDEKMKAKICDFGLMYESKNSLTFFKETNPKGTPLWMAPELFENKPNYSVYSDVYSFGMVVFEVVQEEMPFKEVKNLYSIGTIVQKGDRPKVTPQLNDSILKGLVEVMKQCWVQSPKDRPTFDDILLMLNKLE